MPAAAQATSSASLSGTVKDGAGTPIAGAIVTLTGPQNATATTDPTGDFVLIVKPGIYTVAVTRGGFQSVTLNDLAVVAGSQPLTVTLSRADLSTLRTIGSVSTSARGSGSTINTGAAVTGYLSAQTFADLAS
ncbi:MAG: carboxypeptidase-like regulatory domain-containing protein, partial [Vulcanimicrobiaceae bacterium]